MSVRPSLCLSVRFRGKHRPLIKIEVCFLRASLLMDVVILVFKIKIQLIKMNPSVCVHPVQVIIKVTLLTSILFLF